MAETSYAKCRNLSVKWEFSKIHFNRHFLLHLRDRLLMPLRKLLFPRRFQAVYIQRR